MKQKTYKELLFNILSIIGYQNNKEKFVADFDIVNRLDAAASIIDTYPLALKRNVMTCKNVNDLHKYINAEDYKEAYTKVTQKVLQEFISFIANTLSANQKQRIVDIISTY